MKKLLVAMTIVFFSTIAYADYLACDIPEQVADDPASVMEQCTGIGEPWALCTGAGTCMHQCDEAVAYNIASYIIQIDGGEEMTITNWTDDPGKNERKLLDIVDMPNANFIIWAANVQGRRSPPVPFVLYLKPYGPGGLRVVE